MPHRTAMMSTTFAARIHRSSRHIAKLACSAIAAICMLAGCDTHVRTFAKAPVNEFPRALAANQCIKKIVLRAPSPRDVVATQAARNRDPYDSIYNAIEKTLLSAGYVVRDRALLNQVLHTNPNLDYRLIHEKIDTDLIIEIQSIDVVNLGTDKYHTLDGRTNYLVSGAFGIHGVRFEAKIITVATGDVAGFITFTALPQPLEEPYDFIISDRHRVKSTASPQGDAEPYTRYAVIDTNAGVGFAVTLMSILSKSCQ